VKERIRTFSKQAVFLIHLLVTLLFIETAAIIVILDRNGVFSAKVSLLAIVLMSFVFCAVGFLYVRNWYYPYRKYCDLVERFIRGETYKELIDSDYQICPEMRTMLKRFDSMLDRQNAVKLSTKQAEFLALQNQINPHFLYNTLEAIRGDALCAGLENISLIAEALSTFFRYTITETENLVTLEDELENVENYFLIQQYRFGDKLRMEINLPEEETDILQLQLPKLTLQPIIENAIFHGLERKSEGGTITIEAETTPERVLLSIRDNGAGMTQDTLDEINDRLSHVFAGDLNDDKKKKGSIALTNVCRRIKLLFGEDYGIHIFSIEGVGTDVRISIPAIRKQKDQ
jgi:two-component system sensor histidine kinase YesM